MKKIKIEIEDLKNFSIHNLHKYEGCPDASRFLLKEFGDKVDDLRNYETYINNLIIKHNKPHWAINFMLNLMRDEYRLKFFNLVYKETILNIKDYELKKLLNKAMKGLEKNETVDLSEAFKQLELDSLVLSHNILANEDKYNLSMFKLKLISTIILLQEDSSRKFTRSLTEALTSLASAYDYLDPQSCSDNINQKKLALRLVDYSGIFK